ncbi:MAG: type II toxin-antitoxin system RelE/ParE family toxin [Candidatus Rokubacteria bacterium]|nr:type II toxin-antitoxin system RelE/ParE family toxin [Candidatus Rokubacteria bacterium]
MTDPVHTIRWTETALELAAAVPDQRIRRLINHRVDQLAKSPEQQDKPLVGELASLRSVRAVGQRYRIVLRVQRREVVVAIVAVGKRTAGDKGDIYELAKKLLRLGLLR